MVLTSLLDTEHQVDPGVQPLADVLALQRFPHYPHKLVG